MTDRANFRVLVAGGGIAGLTLANALERANIDCVLLEGRDKFAANEGASIAVLPNGCRILDQFGLYEAFLDTTEPVKFVYDRDNAGVPLAPPSDFPHLGYVRTGYHQAFGDRQALLQLMVNSVKGKSKLLVNKKVISVTHSPTGVTAKCEDGTTYTGDILVGADGVHSKTRDAMFDLAADEYPDKIKKDREALTAEYQCLFGICTKVEGMEIGEGEYGYDQDRSSLAVVVKNGRTYYFIFQKMAQILRGTNMPRYSEQETEEFAKAHFDMVIRPGVHFKALWDNSIASNLVVLEEGSFEVWTHGRIVCIGDSIHKMTPNIGNGGNMAIETAAALANTIHELATRVSPARPTETEIKGALTGFQTLRKAKTDIVTNMSNGITRFQALQKASLPVIRKLLPCVPELAVNLQSEIVVGAPAINFLPIPRRSVTGTMPFNPTQGLGKTESKLRRFVIIVIPFIILLFLATASTNPASLSTTALLPVANGAMILATWLIEGSRCSNYLTPACLPLVFITLGHFFGMATIAPVYYTLHYVFSPIDVFKASDMRLTNAAYTRCILPSLMVAYFAPLYASFAYPAFSSIMWGPLRGAYPLIVALLCRLSPFRDTIQQDRLVGVKRDIPAIRTTLGVLVVGCAVVWWWSLFSSLSVFRSLGPGPWAPGVLVAEWMGRDAVLALGSAFVWLAFLFGDIKHVGMLGMGWSSILVAACAAVVVVGPGGAVGLGFLWREEVLASRRHRAALTEDRAREVNRVLGVEW